MPELPELNPVIHGSESLNAGNREEKAMTEETDNRELRERLDLIETMIAEGRQMTGNWGWVFVLWGVAYFIAFAWASSGWNSMAAWPVTVVVAGLVTVVTARRRLLKRPRSWMARAVSSVWRAVGVALLVVLFSLQYGGRLDGYTSLAIAGAMLAVANGASAMILRWRVQLVCALVWLATAVVSCFGTERLCVIAFLVANLFCQIVFGTYLIITESRRQHVHGEAHA